MKVLGIFLLLFISSCSYLPEPYEQDTDVNISETTEYILMESEGSNTSSTLFIFYPGGLVDPHAYITMLSGVVEMGYTVIIIKVNGNLAITEVNKAKNIVSEFPDYDHYILGGHSLGAAVTCIAANRDRDLFEGLVVMAGYPTENASLADWDTGSILAFDALEDQVINRETLENSRAYFPPIRSISSLEEMDTPSQGETLWVEIQGGNHSQYGDYGFQQGDGSATITVGEQHEILNAFILEYFKANGW